MALLPNHKNTHSDQICMDGNLRKVGSETMIVRIKHVWYQDKRYDLGKSPDSRDIQEFLHDLRAVAQFCGVCDVRLVKGDKVA